MDRYLEALEQARNYYPDNLFLDIIFPELAESEDERILNALITHISIYEGDFKTVGVTRLEMLSWLEKQKEEEQKPAELSEKDERLLNIIIDILDREEHNGYLTHGDLNACVKLLKSIRPSWKPSEEQIKALGIAIRCGIQLGTWEEDALKSLCNELKKLM